MVKNKNELKNETAWMYENVSISKQVNKGVPFCQRHQTTPPDGGAHEVGRNIFMPLLAI